MPLLIQKNFSVIKDNLKDDSRYRCKRCMGPCRPIDERPKTRVALEGIKLSVILVTNYVVVVVMN